jgi:branched-chain amino acid transport system permease protein
MGLKNSLAMAGVIAIGGLFWKGVISFSQSSQFQSFWNNSKKWGDPILQWRPRPWQQKILEIVAWGGLILIPQDMNNYYLDVLTTAGIYVVLALGLNIVVGMAGLLDLGYISFYAIGAYTYAILSTQFGVPFWIGLPIGGMAAGSLGVVLGLVTLRLRGDYIAIVTLGFVQIIYLILKNWDSVTNGPNGILNIPRPSLGSFLLQDPIHLYYLILLIVALTVFAVSRLIHSRVGRSWMAIREDEVAAQAMGVDTTRMKILAFGLGAFWAGLAGVFFSAKMAFVSPESFTFFESVFILTMVVLGGMGSIPGVILGAVVLIVLPEMFRGFESYRMLLFGGAMVLMMIFRPQGLIGNPRRKVELQTGNKTALS